NAVSRGSQAIRIATGFSVPQAKGTVTLAPPEELLSSGDILMMFAQFIRETEEDGTDGFEPLLDTTYDAVTHTLRASVPPEAFASRPDEGGTVEAIIYVATIRAFGQSLPPTTFRISTPSQAGAVGVGTFYSSTFTPPCLHSCVHAPLRRTI